MNISTIAFSRSRGLQGFDRSAPRPAEAPLFGGDRISLGPESDQVSERSQLLSNALLENFSTPANIGQKQQDRDEQKIRIFEESLPASARESFRKLDGKKKLDVARLGQAFPGLAINDSPLLKMMEDGRLFEKDLGGASPLQRLTEVARPDRPDFRKRTNFVQKVLAAVENPTTSKDASKEKGADPRNPAEFIRKAGERYHHDTTLGRPSHWDQPASL